MGVRTVVGAFRNSAKAVHLEVLEQAERAGVKTEQIDCSGKLDRRAIARIKALLEQYDVDVIHTHGIKSDLYALLASGKRGVRLVGTCHSWTMDSLKHRGISLMDRLLLTRFDGVAIVTESLRPRLLRLGVKDERVHTIDNGIDCTPFSSLNTDTHQSTQGDRLVVGAVARLARVKGLRYLLDAAALLIPDFPSARFVIVGEGPDLTLLRDHAAGLGIGASVHFMGSSSNLPDIYAGFDIFVLPSLSEGMPMALMEAMASGRAVVASAVGSVPNMIVNNRNGILVQPADSASLASRLKELLSNSSARATLGQAARETAIMRFSAAAMARAYLSLYESVMVPLGEPRPWRHLA